MECDYTHLNHNSLMSKKKKWSPRACVTPRGGIIHGCKYPPLPIQKQTYYIPYNAFSLKGEL
jgi:hypothetical protein